MRTFRGTVLAILVVITPLFFAAPALAQAKPAPPKPMAATHEGVGIGLLGGMNRTSTRGEESDSTTAGSGAMFGIWFGGNRNGRVGFMGEVDYVVKKVNISDDSSSDASLSSKYIEIPALFRVNIGNKSRNGVSVYALGGPVFDIRLSSKITIGGATIEDEFEDAFSAADIGIMFGVGVEVTRFGFEIRGNWGQKQLATDDAIDSGFLPKAKTNSVQFLGKFRFN